MLKTVRKRQTMVQGSNMAGVVQDILTEYGTMN